MVPTPVQERPWQWVATDLFFWEKKTYIVDFFSRYIEVAHLKVASAETALKDVFSRNGPPQTVVSDNGPQFSGSPFQNFAIEYGFTHVTSSPRYPQGNGEAERAVATVKGLWKGGGDKAKALMAYRATPLESGYSPPTYNSQRLYSLAGQTSENSGNRRCRQRRINNVATTCVTEPVPYPRCSVAKMCGSPKRTEEGTVIQQANNAQVIHRRDGRRTVEEKSRSLCALFSNLLHRRQHLRYLRPLWNKVTQRHTHTTQLRVPVTLTDILITPKHPM